MEKVYIVGACRTAIGKMGGILYPVPTVDLGATVIKGALERSGIPAGYVDHVYMGCVLQAGLGQNVARQAALKAGLPYSTTAETLNIVCGSGLDSVNSGARLIRSGDADIVVAGGMENMSRAPFAVMQGRYGYRMGEPMSSSSLVDTMINDALWDASNDYHMGVTAENVAEKWNFSRQELDEFALNSQEKACRAINAGTFTDEIVPVKIPEKAEEKTVATDEGPRFGITIEHLKKLKPVFKPDGIVTAGNSSGINDGAAALILVGENKLKELELTPMAEWIDGALGGVDPAFMGIAPVVSTRKLLNKLQLDINDIDLFEVNEAFAAQALAVQRELQIPSEKLNINGGAIALGHPVGASGCRILVTLLYSMMRENMRLGLASLCIGGGMGCSVIIKSIVKSQ